MTRTTVKIQPKSLKTASRYHHSPSNPSTLGNSSTNSTVVSSESHDNDLLRYIASNNLPKPKLLKSCIRCRKHKTKCDAHQQAPNSCSHCAKKGVECKIDFVLPPQRSDNLKNLVRQVDDIKGEFDKLERIYNKHLILLGVQVESFQQWKLEKGICHNNYLTQEIQESDEDSLTTEIDFDLNKDCFDVLKLSNGSFISMKLLNKSNELIINNKIINIDEFERNLSQLIHFLQNFYQLYNESDDFDENISSTDDSSVGSPCDLNFDYSGPKKIENLDSWLHLKFDIKSMFKSNKFLLLLLISYYYNDEDDFKSTYDQFLKDYLDSYYQIISQTNSYSNSSSYSNYLLTKFNSNYKKNLHFNKNQLRLLIDTDIFNSEIYLKKSLEILFLNVLLFGIDESHYLQNLNEFIKFIEKNINSNRKKINFDKSVELRFITSTLKLFNLLNNDVHFEPSSSSPSSSSSLLSSPSSSSSSSSPPSPSPSTSSSSNISIVDNYIKLITFQNQYAEQERLVNLSNISLFNNRSYSTYNNLNQIDIYKFKNCFQKFIQIWQTLLSFPSKYNFYVSPVVIIVESFIITCLVFINEGLKEFNTVLLKFLSNFNQGNLSFDILELIEYFKKPEIESIQLNFCCDFNNKLVKYLITNKRNLIDLKTNDIQLILENIDWKRETTDDVLKKIGVI